ncbi:hypothetical protein C8K58_111184 [Pseudomonas sp. GV047]|nr:hypothetical protein C8K58_111184 [Pseudomonas sp. GV047]
MCIKVQDDVPSQIRKAIHSAIKDVQVWRATQMCNEVEPNAAHTASIHLGKLLIGFAAVNDCYASIPSFTPCNSVEHCAIVTAVTAGLDNDSASESQVVVQCPQRFKRGVWWGIATIFCIREVSRRAENVAVSIPSAHRKWLLWFCRIGVRGEAGFHLVSFSYR